MFLFQLADRLGKTVTELETDVPYSELIEWAAYCRIIAKHGGNR